jgi:FkbM family methyltransferase
VFATEQVSLLACTRQELELSLCKIYARWLRFWYIRSPLPFELRRLLVALFPHPRTCHVRLAGIEMALDPSDLLQANILLDGVWGRDLSRWWAYLVSSSERIIDVGAHCGYFSLLARRFAPPSAIIHAFEPNPQMQMQYRRNVSLNNFEGMYLAPLAVSDSPGTLTLYIRKMLEPGASSRHRTPHFDQAITVPAVTLDAYCDEQHIDRVDVLKMDIEGGEVAALAGMRDGLKAGRYKVLVIEVHSSLLPPGAVEQMFFDLRKADYALFAIQGEAAYRLADESAAPEQVMAIHADRMAAFQKSADGKRLLLPEEFRALF